MCSHGSSLGTAVQYAGQGKVTLLRVRVCKRARARARSPSTTLPISPCTCKCAFSLFLASWLYRGLTEGKRERARENKGKIVQEELAHREGRQKKEKNQRDTVREQREEPRYLEKIERMSREERRQLQPSTSHGYTIRSYIRSKRESKKQVERNGESASIQDEGARKKQREEKDAKRSQGRW